MLGGIAAGIAENQFVGADAEQEGDLLEAVDGRLRGTGLVTLDLGDMYAEFVGHLLLGQSALLAELKHTGGEVHALGLGKGEALEG